MRERKFLLLNKKILKQAIEQQLGRKINEYDSNIVSLSRQSNKHK